MAKKKTKGRKAAAPTATVIALGSEPSIRDVADLYARCKAAQADAEVIVDGTSVQRVDTAILQALIAFQRSRRTAASTLSIRASDSLRAAIATLGLDQVLPVSNE